MKICFAVVHYTPRLVSEDPAEYLARLPIYQELPRRLAARGHQVELVQAYPFDIDYLDSGVRFHFVAEGRLARAAGRLGGALLGRGRSELEPARRAIRRIVELEPEIVHFHGTTLHLNLALLVRRLPRETPLVIHHHGGELSTRWPTRGVQMANLRRAARLLISSRGQAASYVDGGAFGDDQIVEFMETSSPLRFQPRAEARRETGMTGDPVFLSAARLHPIKDPLIMLAGFERIAAAWPEARLYLVYRSDEMEAEVRAWITARPEMTERIELRGRIAPERMQAVMSSADFLLQASRREWSGVAILDAMACGTIPIVTDIPVFRTLSEGIDGLLFPVGDAEALARRVLDIGREGIERTSRDVRRLFEERWSFSRLAERLEEIYAELSEGSNRPNGRPVRRRSSS